MIREPGYYWVKLQPFDTEMHIAKWTGKYWLLHGETFTISDRSFHEIDPNRVKRRENIGHFRANHMVPSDIDWDGIKFSIGMTAAVVGIFYIIFS